MSARLRGLNPYDLHKHLINEYILCEAGSTAILKRDSTRDRSDLHVIRENHRFLWDDAAADTWEKQLAKKYYDKLFKEYCICDLSRYKENKIAMRWRIEKEVVVGKGQFICANKKCQTSEDLKSWEVNFAYTEGGQRKNALVKCRLCLDCSSKLNYHSKKREVKRLSKKHKRRHRRKSKDQKDEKSADEPVDEIIPDQPSTSSAAKEDSDDDPWKKGNEPEEKSREEEFEEYLEDLLL